MSRPERLKVGVIGLGDIAAKAYLPALAVRPELELRLCTRNEEVLERTAAAYRIERRYTDLGELLAGGIDAAFVHTATAAHVEVVTALLRAGVATYVDKPLADNLDDCQRLADLSRERRCSLFVGFNRRFAPVYRDCLDPNTSLVFMQKNRVSLADSPRRVVFDDFIHVVDTLRFLIPESEFVDVHSIVNDGKLGALAVRLARGATTAIGAMNRNGGYTQESLETHGPGFRRVVHDMAGVEEFSGGGHRVQRRDDWMPVHVQRGFEAICTHFLDAVSDDAFLDPTDALRTHEVCHQILRAVEASDQRR